MLRQSNLSFAATTSVRADKAPNAASAVSSSHDNASTSNASNKRIAPPPPRLPSLPRLTTPPPSQTDMDSSFELHDSTDWHATSLPAFEPLEAALRCEVCKEFYTNPVITSCSHTFCSICIRRCISTDGKCPTCKSASQADKLLPNNAVREIVSKFQDARPKALELAKQDKEGSDASNESRKRKLGDTDIEEGEPVRQTRSRQARSQSQRAEGTNGMPIEVPDSEDDGDETFDPELEGKVRCPICREAMLEVQMFRHLDVCPGSDATGGRATRSSKNNAYPKPLQSRAKEPSPPPTRLPGLNYAMLKQNALVKKLQELGIPTWGKKELLIRRHTEWLHLWNSNCDALENRRSKRDLLKELDVWEKTQGGSASEKEAKVMRKDFDGQAHASAHKCQFDDLIANARRKREATKKDEKSNGEGENGEGQVHDATPQSINDKAAPQLVNNIRPYEGNESALASIREKVERANRESALPSRAAASSPAKVTRPASDEHQGMPDPFTSPTRTMPMFALPSDPVVDVEQSTAAQ